MTTHSQSLPCLVALRMMTSICCIILALGGTAQSFHLEPSTRTSSLPSRSNTIASGRFSLLGRDNVKVPKRASSSLYGKTDDDWDLKSLLSLEKENASTEQRLGETNFGLAQLTSLTQPAQQILDGATSGWALSYANLSPDTEKSVPGVGFLATNMAYALAGLVLTLQGDLWFGLLTDVTAIASFNYHYNQLQVQGEMGAPVVRLALLVDYAFAALSILTASVYLFSSPSFPLEGLEYGAVSLVCLGLCWVYEEGRTYMILHGLWHLFSAYAGYLIGAAHLGL